PPRLPPPFPTRRSSDLRPQRGAYFLMHKSEADAVDQLLQTYSETGGINYLEAAATLPSRPAIEDACTELMSLMFPGFRSESLVRSEEHTSELQSPDHIV